MQSSRIELDLAIHGFRTITGHATKSAPSSSATRLERKALTPLAGKDA
jgi:hypothetical protein